MKNLNLLLSHVPHQVEKGNANLTVTGVTADSRVVTEGSVFVAIKGGQVDGHQFIQNAVAKGAICIVGESFDLKIPDHICAVRVENASRCFGLLMSAWHDFPTEKLKVIGVTGTNGKTTTATLLFDLFTALGYCCGLISTIEVKIGKKIVPATHTTPDAARLQSLFSEMVQAGCSYAFMEVSSHAIHQNRISGIHFKGAVFTNITHDHLDYHGTFDLYLKAKKQFFDDLPKDAFALVNMDDKRGMVMVQNTRASIKTYALKRMASFKTRLIANGLDGLQLEINGKEFFSRLIGSFNAYNLTAAYASATLLGVEESLLRTKLSGLTAAAGRFDYFRVPHSKVMAIVDYAHTPDALLKVMETIHKMKPAGARILTVVGCGGDRDKEKRPEMAKVAANLSDLTILTSDNPRTEEPVAIIDEMAAGLSPAQLKNMLRITDRKEAIRTACHLVKHGDILLVAGKGHEPYQEIMGIKYPFDDKKILQESLLGDPKALTN
jgi:UDP-N-acetylmuramoyl-L-alanyl-D-glutamate--2,6-diaminopimelate ligase